MTEPEKVIAPMAIPRPSSIRLTIRIWPASSTMPKLAGSSQAARPTTTAARPTSEWNPATSSGIAVIAILRAMVTPMMPPRKMAIPISGIVAKLCVTRVVATAMTMPIMP